MIQDNASVEPTQEDMQYAAARPLLMADAREMIGHLSDWRKAWALGSTDRNRVILGAALRVIRGLYALAHQTPPATQPTATVGEVERLGAALCRQLRSTIHRLNGQAYSSLLSALNAFEATLHTPPPVATATGDAGWQDISGAPRDGTAFDVWLPADEGGYRIADLYFSARGLLIRGGAPADLPRWPSHWRATPTPPAGDK